jgi:hypothetical protein
MSRFVPRLAILVAAAVVAVNDFDPDGDRIASAFGGEPTHGTVLAVAEDGAFVYEPDPGFVGVDSFAYAVRDDLGTFTGLVIDVTITVTPQRHGTTASTRALGHRNDVERVDPGRLARRRAARHRGRRPASPDRCRQAAWTGVTR